MLVEIACVASVIFWGKLDHSVSLESIGSCCAERRERENKNFNQIVSVTYGYFNLYVIII